MNKEEEIVKVSELPNLHEAKTSQRELSSEYWTPEEAQEYKVGVILSINSENYTNDETGEKVELPCIIMLAQDEDGTFNTIRNGSKRLVATIETAIESGEVELMETPVRITYVGKKKNKTNSFSSDRWSVKPILL